MARSIIAFFLIVHLPAARAQEWTAPVRGITGAHDDLGNKAGTLASWKAGAEENRGGSLRVTTESSRSRWSSAWRRGFEPHEGRLLGLTLEGTKVPFVPVPAAPSGAGTNSSTLSEENARLGLAVDHAPTRAARLLERARSAGRRRVTGARPAGAGAADFPGSGHPPRQPAPRI